MSLIHTDAPADTRQDPPEHSQVGDGSPSYPTFYGKLWLGSSLNLTKQDRKALTKRLRKMPAGGWSPEATASLDAFMEALHRESLKSYDLLIAVETWLSTTKKGKRGLAAAAFKRARNILIQHADEKDKPPKPRDEKDADETAPKSSRARSLCNALVKIEEWEILAECVFGFSIATEISAATGADADLKKEILAFADYENSNPEVARLLGDFPSFLRRRVGGDNGDDAVADTSDAIAAVVESKKKIPEGDEFAADQSRKMLAGLEDFIRERRASDESRREKWKKAAEGIRRIVKDAVPGRLPSNRGEAVTALEDAERQFLADEKTETSRRAQFVSEFLLEFADVLDVAKESGSASEFRQIGRGATTIAEFSDDSWDRLVEALRGLASSSAETLSAFAESDAALKAFTESQSDFNRERLRRTLDNAPSKDDFRARVVEGHASARDVLSALPRKSDEKESDEPVVEEAEATVAATALEEEKKRREEIEAQALKDADARRDAEERASEAERDAFYLRTRIEELETRLGESAKEEIEIPTSLAELGEWTGRHFAGKVTLIERAAKAAAESAYEDVSLVYNAVRMMAEEYRRARMRSDDDKKIYQEFNERLEALHLEEEPVGELSALSERDGRFRIPWKGGVRYLERHLKKGNSRDPRWCFRLYYFWDEETSQAVVGWLPGHLTTRNS